MTKRTLFGTDGIRGCANEAPMTPDVVMRVGMAVAAHFGHHGQVVVGKDTRLSCYMFENALSAGLCAMGVDVMFVGPMPTPAVAYLVQSMRADAGVMVSASHNVFQDNGIKLFAGDGFKLPDAVEQELEGLAVPGALDGAYARGSAVGRARRIDDAPGRYITHVKSAFTHRGRLDGIKLVVDCAHGAAYKIAPTVLRELGAEVIALGVSPNGTNINDGVGALHAEQMAKEVVAHGADLGIALDGDADRIIFSDQHGRIVDGDAVLALCAREMADEGTLRGGGVVTTVMSNLGVERALVDMGLDVVRTPVGDRYVVEAMRTRGFNLGGEQSGHVVLLDHATTGDAVATALKVLSFMVAKERSLADLCAVFERVPQRTGSFVSKVRRPVEELKAVAAVVRDAEEKLGATGRVLVRWSGTETKLRFMVEGEDDAQIRAIMGALEEAAGADLGA